MKRGKKLIYLSSTLILVILAYWGVSKINEAQESAQEDTSTPLLSLTEDSISQICFEYNNDSITLSSHSDSWVYPDDLAFPVDQSFPETMVTNLSTLSASKVIDEPEALAEYGLDQPVCTIQVTAADTQYKLEIGNESTLSSEYYLSIGDDKVYLVSDALLSAFSYELDNLLKLEDIPDMTDVQSFTIQSDTQNMEIDYLEESDLTYSDDYVWFMNSDDDYLALDSSLTTSLIENISNLTWTSCVSYNTTTNDLTNYGLDQPAVTATLTYLESEDATTSRSFTLEIGNLVDGFCYARIAGSPMVYLINGSISDTLLNTSYEDLRPDDIG